MYESVEMIRGFFDAISFCCTETPVKGKRYYALKYGHMYLNANMTEYGYSYGFTNKLKNSYMLGEEEASYIKGICWFKGGLPEGWKFVSFVKK